MKSAWSRTVKKQAGPGQTRGFGSSRPPKELARTVLTLAIIATMAHAGCTSPVTASGTPIALKANVSARFCTVFRYEALPM